MQFVLDSVVVGKAAIVVILNDYNSVIPNLELRGLHYELGWALLFKKLLLIWFVFVDVTLVTLVIHVGVHNFLKGELLFIELVSKFLSCPTCVNWDHSPISIESDVLVMYYVKIPRSWKLIFLMNPKVTMARLTCASQLSLRRQKRPLPKAIGHVIPYIEDLLNITLICPQS